MAGRKNKNVVCVDHSKSKGEYLTLSKEVWELDQVIELAPEFLNFPTSYRDTELRIYANIITVKGEDDSVFSDNEDKLNLGHWQDIRKTEKNGLGKPFEVLVGCSVRVPAICRNTTLRVYVEKSKT